VFELVLVVQDGVIGVSVHPDSVDDFEPSMSQATQGIGMTLAFLTMAAVVDLRPRAASEGLLGKEVHGMAQMPVAGPSLVAGPARRIGSGFARKSKQSLAHKSSTVVYDLSATVYCIEIVDCLRAQSTI
jgi:hypothetical protein